MIAFLLIFILMINPISDIESDPEFKNIIVLLDLSNRIKPTKNPKQAEKDQQIIQSLINSFEERQRKYLFQRSKDKLSVVVANQRDSEIDVHQYGEKLSIDMTSSRSKRMNKPIFDNEKQALTESLENLYAEAIKAKTTGADIWTYFRDNLGSDLESSSEYENYVVILTDGYMDFDEDLAKVRQPNTFMNYSNIHELRNKKDWEDIFVNQNMALQPHPGEFNNTKILVLEIIPKDPVVNVNELPIIKKFWSTWLDEMEISHQIHETNNNSRSTGNILTSFIFQQ
ncbi:MAG: hypothetical protein WD604_08135 [Balneolaceae bacterium]